MGYKCVPQLVGLVRGEAKGKHRANGKAICGEAGKERVSRSQTLDPSRSADNVYNAYNDAIKDNSGFSAWDYMLREADAYRQEVKRKDGSTAYRSLRADAVIGWAMIFNPPADVCASWTDDDYQQFYADSIAVMTDISPIFRAENAVFDAEHRDEGPEDPPSYHMHRIGWAKAKDGRFAGNTIDAALCARICAEYPRRMRERSAKWADMDDLDVTDWERYKTDDEYRAQRKAKAKMAGRSVNAYIADKTAEEAGRTATVAMDAIQQAQAAMAAAEAARLEYEELNAELDRLKVEHEEIDEKMREIIAHNAASEQESMNISELLRRRGSIDGQREGIVVIGDHDHDYDRDMQR